MENVSFVSFVFTIARPALLVLVLLDDCIIIHHETAEPQGSRSIWLRHLQVSLHLVATPLASYQVQRIYDIIMARAHIRLL
jgi:hypothetical protein